MAVQSHRVRRMKACFTHPLDVSRSLTVPESCRRCWSLFAAPSVESLPSICSCLTLMAGHRANKVFCSDHTFVCSFADNPGFQSGTITARRGKILITPLQFWEKGFTYNYTWFVNVFTTAYGEVTYSCLAIQKDLNSVLLWLQHKLWANFSARASLWAPRQSPCPSPFSCSARTCSRRAAFPTKQSTHNACTLLSGWNPPKYSSVTSCSN